MGPIVCGTWWDLFVAVQFGKEAAQCEREGISIQVAGVDYQ
jgi:hypothetical protein